MIREFESSVKRDAKLAGHICVFPNASILQIVEQICEFIEDCALFWQPFRLFARPCMEIAGEFNYFDNFGYFSVFTLAQVLLHSSTDMVLECQELMKRLVCWSILFHSVLLEKFPRNKLKTWIESWVECWTKFVIKVN